MFFLEQITLFLTIQSSKELQEFQELEELQEFQEFIRVDALIKEFQEFQEFKILAIRSLLQIVLEMMIENNRRAGHTYRESQKTERSRDVNIVLYQ